MFLNQEKGLKLAQDIIEAFRLDGPLPANTQDVDQIRPRPESCKNENALFELILI